MKPLNPIMAALLAASSAAFALPRTAHAAEAATDAAQAAHLQAVEDLNFVMPRLISLFGREDARKDAGARFVKFVQGKESGAQYLTDALLKDKTLLPATLAVVQAWPEKNKDNPGRIAALYFVIGPETEKLPSWAPAEFNGKFKPKMEWSARLTADLAAAHWSDSNRVSQSDAANAVDAFLNDAAKWAQKIIDDTRTNDQVRSSAGANDTTGSHPPITGSGSSIPGADSGFGFDSLYVTGSKVERVYGPHDDGYRTISVKIFSAPDGKGNFINKIGITDITKGDLNTPSVTKYVSISDSGDTPIQLSDGGRKYTVTVGKDGSVTVARGGTGAGPGGKALSTNIQELMTKRNTQIMTAGTVDIDGERYRVLGQGGTKGSLLFFSEQELLRNPKGDAHPVLMGDVSQVLDDGSTGMIKGKPPLGKLQNGDDYHLEYKNGAWTVVKGPGDVPADAAKDKPDPKADPNAPNPDPNASNPDPNAPSGATLEQIMSKLPEKWEQAGNDGFSPAVKQKIRIVKHWDKGPTVWTVFFDPSLGLTSIDITPSVGEKDQFQALAGVRGFGDYIIFEYAHSKEYLSFANFIKWAKRESIDPDMIMDPRVGMQNVTSVDMALDMLTHYFDLKKDQIDKLLDAKDGLRARVAARAHGADYVISGNGELVYFAQGAKGMEIWPKVIASGDNGTNDKLTGLRGPGTVVEMVGGGRADFQQGMELAGHHDAKLVKGQAHAAMYTAQDTEFLSNGESKTATLWYIMLDYTKNGNPARTKPIPVFGGQDRFALPKGFEMQGLESVNLPDTAQLMMLHGSTQEKGAIVAFRTTLPDNQGGQNVKDKAGNCGGPVIWWGGETKEQAQKACETDAKVR